MSEAPYIPAKTIKEMIAAHPPGSRHAAMFKIAMPLVGNGMDPAAVRAQLRATFPDEDKTDKEIADVVDWCVSRNPTPSGFGSAQRSTFQMPTRPVPAQAPQKKLPPAENAAAIVGKDTNGEQYWRDRSPIILGDNFADDAALMMSYLYTPEDKINILTNYTVNDKGKANPQGSGKTLGRDEWLDWFKSKGVPESKAGAWIRPNPSTGTGSGKDGAVTDADTASHRFLMVESDTLPLEVQFTLLSKLALPIAALILSGGDSVHAWVRVNCKDADEYRQTAKQFYALAETLGFDPANKNSSRLSRLPGVRRRIGNNEDGRQRLVYLNNKTEPYSFARFEASAAVVPNLIRADSLRERFREHMRPKKAAFTIPFLAGVDPDTGFYFRNGEVTLWSGMAGHGKSTMLSTVMLRLLAEARPFFICSLEYKPEKMIELLARIMYQRPITVEEGEDFLTTAGDLFSFSDTVGEIPPEKLFEQMRSAHYKWGAQHFFIDSLMRVQGLEEDYPAQGRFVNTLTKIAQETGGHIHLVAHPRKIDEGMRAKKMDVKGSTLIVNNVDNMVTIRRNTAKKDLYESGELTDEADAKMHDAEFAVEKQRETGWECVIKLRFNRITKTFGLFVPPAKAPKKAA